MKCHLHPDRDAVGYCVTCGQGVCAECRREVAGTIRCPAHVAAAPAPAAPPPVKSGFLAGLFSIMFPGMGHLYAGAYSRALRFGGIATGLIVILSMGGGRMERLAPLFGLSLFFVWAYALFDAVRVAHEINAGTYLVAPVGAGVPAVRRSGTGTLTLGVILLGIGGLIAVDRYVELDRFFDWVGDNIGFIFIALGVVLIAAYARRRGREKDRELAAAPPPADITGPTSSFLK
ncbi:MAG TPA: B-box zinc finger protein [Thermoanaerobaculia bacterium]|nr:B-box zinc finger protein [Thermoanaerobaculia bacterium]